MNTHAKTTSDQTKGDIQLSSGNITPEEIVLEGIPEDERAIAEIAIARYTQITESYVSPIPPPRVLLEYENVLPGSPDRLLSMVERQQAHRHSLEKSVVTSDITLERIGLILAFVLGALVTTYGFILIFNDKAIQGIILLITYGVPMAGTFIYMKNKGAKELEKENRELKSEINKLNPPNVVQPGANKNVPVPRSKRSAKRKPRR